MSSLCKGGEWGNVESEVEAVVSKRLVCRLDGTYTYVYVHMYMYIYIYIYIYICTYVLEKIRRSGRSLKPFYVTVLPISCGSWHVCSDICI